MVLLRRHKSDTRPFGRLAARAFALAATLVLTGALAAEAATVRPGFDDHSLADYTTHAAPADIGFTVQMGDLSFDQLYVHGSGVVTFGSDRLAAAPRSIPRNGKAPILAPFWVDIDTRLRSNVTFGQGVGDNGERAFAVTWREMSPFARGANGNKPKNTFQLLLVDRGNRLNPGAFDIYFIYEKIEYDQGAIARRKRGGVRDQKFATAGGDFGAGGKSGTYFMVPGSGEKGALVDGGAQALSQLPPAPSASVRLNQGQGTFTSPQTQPPPVPPVPAPPALFGALAVCGVFWIGARRRRRGVT